MAKDFINIYHMGSDVGGVLLLIRSGSWLTLDLFFIIIILGGHTAYLFKICNYKNIVYLIPFHRLCMCDVHDFLFIGKS